MIKLRASTTCYADLSTVCLNEFMQHEPYLKRCGIERLMDNILDFPPTWKIVYSDMKLKIYDGKDCPRFFVHNDFIGIEPYYTFITGEPTGPLIILGAGRRQLTICLNNTQDHAAAVKAVYTFMDEQYPYWLDPTAYWPAEEIESTM